MEAVILKDAGAVGRLASAPPARHCRGPLLAWTHEHS